jgi:hypothetical protein
VGDEMSESVTIRGDDYRIEFSTPISDFEVTYYEDEFTFECRGWRDSAMFSLNADEVGRLLDFLSDRLHEIEQAKKSQGLADLLGKAG